MVGAHLSLHIMNLYDCCYKKIFQTALSVFSVIQEKYSDLFKTLNLLYSTTSGGGGHCVNLWSIQQKRFQQFYYFHL